MNPHRERVVSYLAAQLRVSVKDGVSVEACQLASWYREGLVVAIVHPSDGAGLSQAAKGGV